MNDETLPKVAWSYPNPAASFAVLKVHLAVYAELFDLSAVEGERLTS